MDIPKEWDKIPQGQIFQISPEGTDPMNVEYGGEFLIGSEYFNWGVQGYLACVYEIPGLVRYKGAAFLRVKWEYIEFVGSAFWFRKDKEEPISSSES